MIRGARPRDRKVLFYKVVVQLQRKRGVTKSWSLEIRAGKQMKAMRYRAIFSNDAWDKRGRRKRSWVPSGDRINLRVLV